MAELLFKSPEVCDELISVASAMIDGRLNLIEGVREINRLRFGSINPDDAVFNVIRGVDSETDHFPIGKLRTHCTEGYLSRADRELESYLDIMKSKLLVTCKEILRMCN